MPDEKNDDTRTPDAPSAEQTPQAHPVDAPPPAFDNSGGVSQNDWAEAARQLSYYRLEPVYIASAIDALHKSSIEITEGKTPLTLTQMTGLMRTIAPITALLREQAVIYDRIGVGIAMKATTFVEGIATAKGAKALSATYIDRIKKEATAHVGDYVALLSAESANGETLLKALRKMQDVRMYTGEPIGVDPDTSELSTKKKNPTQADLNTPDA